AGVSSSKTKPSRDQMYTILTPIVKELKELENGRYFDLKVSNGDLEPLRVFLLAACLDKPAQAITQNLNEPIGAYGCGRCELAETLTGSIHATRRHGTEIENNIRILREACIEAEQSNFNLSLRSFIENIHRTKRTVICDSRSETIKTQVRVCTRDADPVALKQIQESINNNNIELFKTCYIGSNRFTISSNHEASKFTDSCILFVVNSKLRFGFIRHIIRINYSLTTKPVLSLRDTVV
ncbi:unnamed protein product, partial [Rotaria sordida]